MQKGFPAGAKLRQHTAADDCIPSEWGNLVDGEPAHHLAIRAAHAGNVGEKDQRVGMCGNRAGGGHLVRIDVVVLAVEAEGETGEHRHRTHLPDRFKPAWIGADDLANEAEVRSGALFARTKDEAIAAGEPDGRLAMRSQGSDEVFVDAPGEHHQRGIASLGVRDTQPGNEHALLAQRLQGAGQRYTAAMDNRDLVTVTHHLDDRPGAAVQRLGILERRASKLHHVSHNSPSVSCHPFITFRFWTACPAAPFSRLSRQLMTTHRRPSGASWKPRSQKLVRTTCWIWGK